MDSPSFHLKPSLLLLALATLAIGVIARCVGIVFAPSDWLDSVQIAEIARPFFCAEHWGMNILPGHVESDGPWAVYWLGSAVQEFAFRIFGREGPRFAVYLAHVAASVLAWRMAGLLGGLMVFSFAPLAQGVNYGRVDAYALLLVVGAVFLAQRRRSIAAGACSAAAVMSWFSAVFAVPLAFWAIGIGREGRWSAILRFGAGFAVAAALLGIPFYGCLGETWWRFGVICASFAGMDGGIGAKCTAFVSEVASLYGVAVALAGVVLAVAAVRAVRSGDWWNVMPVAAFAAFTVVCLFKRSYVFRSVYFLPFVIVAIELLGKVSGPAKVVRFSMWVLAALMFVQTAVYWPISLWRSREWRDYGRLKHELEKEVGRDVGIYCDTYQPYYVGRELSWRQYRTWCGERKGMSRILGRDDIDLYIGHGKYPDAEVADMLGRTGFCFEKIVMPVEELAWDDMHWWRLGPYNLWRKRK